MECRAGQTGRTRAGVDDTDVFDRLARQFEGVEHRRTTDDGRPVLVIVEDGNGHRVAERFLDRKTGGSADVLKIDRPKSRCHQLHRLDDLFHVFCIEFNIEGIDISESLEKDRLAFHHRLARQSADVSETQHGGAIGDDTDEISARRIQPRRVSVVRDFTAGFCNTRRISQGEIPLCEEGFRWVHFQLPWGKLAVILQSLVGVTHQRTTRSGEYFQVAKVARAGA